MLDTFQRGHIKSLIDFLHYVDNSSEESIPSDCDERLKHLHQKVSEIEKMICNNEV